MRHYGREKMTRPRVAVEKVGENPGAAVDNILARFPCFARRIQECEKVFIKINAVYFHPHLHTSFCLIESVVDYIRRIDPKKTIYLMENCSQATFTRLCFSAIGLDTLARKLSVLCLYLDEQKWVKLEMDEASEKASIRFPKILHESLLVNRPENLYINMPVLKAHCQAQMTAGIKNQMGLLYDKDKTRNHNHRLHQKLVDLMRFIQPDFTIVDALKVLERGPACPAKFLKERLHERDLFIGGENVVAVDAVCAGIMGHDPMSIKHVALAARQGLGEAALDAIEVEPEMPACHGKIPWEPEWRFPESTCFVIGKEGACYESCVGFAEQAVELLVNENNTPEKFANRPLTIIMGKGFETEQITGLQEPIILLGKCACDELLETLRGRYSRLDAANSCGRFDDIFVLTARNLKVNAARLYPGSILKMLRLFLIGKTHGLDFKRYRIPRRPKVPVKGG